MLHQKDHGRGTAFSTEEYKQVLKELVGDEYSLLSNYKNAYTPVKLKHNICGYTFDIQPRNFKYRKACKNCYNNKRTITTRDYANKVDELTKGEYELVSPYISSNKKVDIKHVKCGRTLNIEPRLFNSGVRCAYCAGRYLSNDDVKLLVGEKYGPDYEMNAPYINARTKIAVKHIKCGSIFFISLNGLRRAKYHYCKYCYKVFRDKIIPINEYDLIKEEYHSHVIEENYKKSEHKYKNHHFKYTYTDVKHYVYSESDGDYELLSTSYKRTSDKLLIKHISCGNEYEVTFSKFLQGQRCPRCRNSKGEAKVRKYLTDKGINFIEQYKLCINPITNHYLFSDFLILNSSNDAVGVIEYDGEQHFEALRGIFAKRNTLEDNKYRDTLKDTYCHEHNISVCRIPYYKDYQLGHIIDNYLKNIL